MQEEVADLRGSLVIKQRKIDSLEAENKQLRETITLLNERIKSAEASHMDPKTLSKVTHKVAEKDKANRIASGIAADKEVPKQLDLSSLMPEHDMKRKRVHAPMEGTGETGIEVKRDPLAEMRGLSKPGAKSNNSSQLQDVESDTLTTLIKIMEQDTKKTAEAVGEANKGKKEQTSKSVSDPPLNAQTEERKCIQICNRVVAPDKLKSMDYVIGLFTQTFGTQKEHDFFELAHDKKAPEPKRPAQKKPAKKEKFAVKTKRFTCKRCHNVD